MAIEQEIEEEGEEFALTEDDFQDALRCMLEDNEEALQDALEDAGGSLCGQSARVLTFSDVGLMTRNSGLVVRIGDAEFQLTIVRSK